MARLDKGKGRIKTKGGKTKKRQGSMAADKSRSSLNMKRQPRTLERGTGTSYAYAVQNILEDAKHTKGSETGFLGVEDKLLNPLDYAGKSLIHDKD